MSNQPLGLPEDPFADRAALSLDEAERLIQDRVSASGGDGPALFPHETCAEIHRLAAGLPDAVRELAGKAMHAAASAGAETVTPEHVRAATGADDDQPARTRRPSAKKSPSHRHEVTETRAAPEIDDVPDLPAYVSSGIELPMAPSENLPPEARAWVARFIPSEGSEQPHPTAARPASTVEPRPVATRPAPAPADDASAAAEPAGPLPARKAAARPEAPSRLPSARRGRGRRSARPSLALAASVLAILCVIALVMRRQPSTSPSATSNASSIAPASEAPAVPSVTVADRDARDARRSSPARAPGTSEPTRDRSAAPRQPTTRTTPAAQGAPQVRTQPASPIPGANPSPTDESTSAEPSGRILGLEVARYIFEDRARTERDRLVEAGYRVRLLAEWDSGSTVYRVVVGPFASRAAAERAADGLLSEGTVQQARIITIPRED